MDKSKLTIMLLFTTLPLLILRESCGCFIGSISVDSTFNSTTSSLTSIWLWLCETSSTSTRSIESLGFKPVAANEAAFSSFLCCFLSSFLCCLSFFLNGLFSSLLRSSPPPPDGAEWSSPFLPCFSLSFFLCFLSFSLLLSLFFFFFLCFCESPLATGLGASVVGVGKLNIK